MIENVPCPFCGLGCDDLKIAIEAEKVEVKANGCPISIPAFASGSAVDTPRVDGAPVPQREATTTAARLIAESRQPVFAGMGCDVAGVRAVLQLAERVGGTVEPANCESMLRNFLTLQDDGILSATLSEVRNRADLIVIAGADIGRRFPRFFERCVETKQSLFDVPSREIVYLGGAAAALPPGAEAINCANEKLSEIAASLRALVAGRALSALSVAGIDTAKLAALASRMKAARYGVLVWASADFDFPHAELTVQALAALVKDLNRETRFSALPLGGGNGDLTAAQVATWQTGYPLRIDFGRGYAHYDPFAYDASALLKRGEADLLVWVSSFFDTLQPPESSVPVIALARTAAKFKTAPRVFIPVATPGIDHAGHVFRTDNVVAIRLKKLRESALPSVAEAVAAIEMEL
jgi:formylmethanofuran dehydrogenase subunit B